jgi:hypothetical protein
MKGRPGHIIYIVSLNAASLELKRPYFYWLRAAELGYVHLGALILIVTVVGLGPD